MAKYSYAVIRRAIACKIMEYEKSDDWEFIDDVSDWTIYKENKKYHLIKFASNTQDGYKFYFDKRISDINEEIKNIFESLFCLSEEVDCKESKLKISTRNKFYFHLLTTNDFSNFELYCINEFCIRDLHKINSCFDVDSKYYFRLDSEKNDYKQKLCLRPNPCDYMKYDILNSCEIIELKENDFKSASEYYKTTEQYKIDYNRILERSFIHQIEYGTEEELNEILTFYCNENNSNECCKKIKLNCKENDKCKFANLREFIKENQTRLEKKDLITRFNKLSENKKNEYCVYDFKEIFKCFFGTKIDINEFTNKFFGTNIVRKCAYCGVTEDKLNLLYTVRNGRGDRLEYDRIISRDGNKKVEYTLRNIVLACYWCNNAKTDTFSPKDFKPIARGINQVWNEKLLKTKNQNETIYFEENSEIWSYDENNKEVDIKES